MFDHDPGRGLSCPDIKRRVIVNIVLLCVIPYWDVDETGGWREIGVFSYPCNHKQTCSIQKILIILPNPVQVFGQFSKHDVLFFESRANFVIRLFFVCSQIVRITCSQYFTIRVRYGDFIHGSWKLRAEKHMPSPSFQDLSICSCKVKEHGARREMSKSIQSVTPVTHLILAPQINSGMRGLVQNEPENGKC